MYDAKSDVCLHIVRRVSKCREKRSETHDMMLENRSCEPQILY